MIGGMDYKRLIQIVAGSVADSPDCPIYSGTSGAESYLSQLTPVYTRITEKW